MDDNKQKLEENQIPNDIGAGEESKPIFEAVTIDTNLQPEEVAPEVTIAAPEEVGQGGPQIPSDTPPMIYEENKNKYFIIIAGVVVFIVFLFILLKIFLGAKQTPKEISLTYWGLWEDKEIIQPLIDQYRQKNPQIKIDYQKMAPQDYRDKLLARSKDGRGPDMFRFHNTWLSEISELASPLPSSIMSSAEFEKTFYKIHQTDLKVGSYYYGLPLEIDGLVLIYNDDLLKKSGIQTVPTTWDDITEMVPKLTTKDQKGQIISSGIAMGTTSNVEHFSDIFALLLIQNGGNLAHLDQQEAAGALEIYRKIAEQPNEYWNDSMPNSITAFIQEKVAMIIVPSWQASVIKTANPDLKFKVVSVPAGPDGSPISIANYWIEGVSRYSKNQLEAWKFLKYLTEKENMTKLYEIESRVRLFGEPYSRVDLAPLLAQNEYLAPVIKQADHFVSVPMVGRTYDNGLNDGIIKYIENAINAASSGVLYSEALKPAKAGIDQLFIQYQIKTK
ncbi:MAG: extracellular solute-binding protein [bacterium]|nr:extracellular solute-binding protein [bacterium]